MVGRARSLRARGTDVERRLWYRLRNRQIENCKFRRQHPVAGYVFDFACEELCLGIELDGGQHNNARGQQQDTKRTARLEADGWHVLRFWNHDVIENLDGVLTMIADTVTKLSSYPSPENHEG